MTKYLSGIGLETDVSNREFGPGHQHYLSREPVSDEGRCPANHCRYLENVREPNVYILLAIRA